MSKKTNIMNVAGAWKDVIDKEWNSFRKSLNKKWKIKLGDLAGTWKLSDKEAKELTEKIYRERKTQSKI